MAAALESFERTGEPFSGPTGPRTAGNGSLMRLAPVPLYFASDPREAIEQAGQNVEYQLYVRCQEICG